MRITWSGPTAEDLQRQGVHHRVGWLGVLHCGVSERVGVDRLDRRRPGGVLARDEAASALCGRSAWSVDARAWSAEGGEVLARVATRPWRGRRARSSPSLMGRSRPRPSACGSAHAAEPGEPGADVGDEPGPAERPRGPIIHRAFRAERARQAPPRHSIVAMFAVGDGSAAWSRRARARIASQSARPF